MAGEKVRLGVIGVGGMGAGHCVSAQSLEEVQLTAVADIDADRAKEIGEQHGVPYFERHADMLAQDIVDAVVIATPHYFHPPIAIDAFEAGLHVLSEKPIGVRVSMAERMIEAAERSGKVFGVMFQMRTDPAVRKARELVEAGELGEIKRTLLISPEFRSQAYYDSGGWRATWEGEGGGPLMNQGPHIMDLLTLLGGVPSRVTGRTKTLIHDIEVEDHAEAALEYPNGATGYFYLSTCEVQPGRLIEIVGDKGKLRYANGELHFYRNGRPVSEFNRTNTEPWGMPEVVDVEIELPECESGHAAVLRNFARAILYGEKLLAPGADGMKSLELANAIMLSSHKGEPVDIPIDRREFDDLIDHLRSTSTFKKKTVKTKRQIDPRLKAK
jgi:predicted dehydrogenase